MTSHNLTDLNQIVRLGTLVRKALLESQGEEASVGECRVVLLKDGSVHVTPLARLKALRV